jgi:hypothetical protein
VAAKSSKLGLGCSKETKTEVRYSDNGYCHRWANQEQRVSEPPEFKIISPPTKPEDYPFRFSMIYEDELGEAHHSEFEFVGDHDFREVE